MNNLKILLTLLLIPLINAAGQDKTVKQEIETMVAEGRCEEAFNLLDSTLKSNSNQAELYLLRAECYTAKGDNKAAVEDLRTAFSLKPDKPSIFNKGFFIAHKTGNLTEFIRLTDIIIDGRRIKDKKYLADAYYNRGMAKFAKQNDYPGTIEDMLTVLETAPLRERNGITFVYESLVNLKSDPNVFSHYENVFKRCRAVISELESRNISKDKVGVIVVENNIKIIGQILQSLSLNLADLYFEQGNEAKANEVLAKMVEFKPFRTGYAWRSRYYRKKGRLTEAEQDELNAFESMLNDNEEFYRNSNDSLEKQAEQFIKMGDVSFKHKRYKQAVIAYRKAVEIYPEAESTVAGKIAEAEKLMSETKNKTSRPTNNE